MKWILFFLLSSFLLVGCQSEKTKSDNRLETSKSSETQPSSHEQDKNPPTTSSSSQEEEVKEELVYNGSYYSLTGQYGEEIIIVNKKYPLAASYAPGENPTAQAAFFQLLEAMREAGYAVSSHYSGFRSYETQAGLYQAYVARDGQASADRYSARPGHSEHQTGLAFDLLDEAGNLLTEEAATTWLAHHAHDYGFIVRYLPEKEEVTGYMAESWHIRYIGQEAKAIYESGLTLEEYFGVAGGDYAD